MQNMITQEQEKKLNDQTQQVNLSASQQEIKVEAYASALAVAEDSESKVINQGITSLDIKEIKKAIPGSAQVETLAIASAVTVEQKGKAKAINYFNATDRLFSSEFSAQ